MYGASMTPLQDEEERKRKEAAALEAGKIEREEQEWGPGGQPKASEQTKGRKFTFSNDKPKGKSSGIDKKAASDFASKGADFFKALGATTKYQGPVDTGTKVQQNPGGKDQSLSTTGGGYKNNTALLDDNVDYLKGIDKINKKEEEKKRRNTYGA